jgi:mannose-1-phosphate guanylyltransferase/mannose-6-phosphate isomerase
MLQETAHRVQGAPFLDPIVICNVRHGALAQAQLAEAGIRVAEVILEPLARNTCAAAVIAALWAIEHAPGSEVLLMPADHMIPDREGFRLGVSAALHAAEDNIVTFGVTPTAPETGYGYIRSGAALYDGVHSVSRFVEKPDRALAEKYLSEGGYTWNAGIFLFRPQLLHQEALAFCPDVVGAVARALDAANKTNDGLLLDEASFARAPSVSIDVAVMEKTRRAAVAPIDVGWADIGSWSELWRLSAQDEQGNVGRGDTLHLDSSGCLLWSDGPSISVIGVEDIVVIATADHVLVLPRSRAQDVKRLVELRKERS